MRALLPVMIAVGAMAGAAGPELRRFEAVEPHMGTLVRITIYTPDEQSARQAFRAGFDRIRQLESILSDYREDSELNRIARTGAGTAVPVSEDLFAVLAASQHLAEATGGAFDITQGPVVRLWREARKTRRLPDPDALRDAAGRTGFRKLHLDTSRRTVTFAAEGMALDAGAIGKGYAASEALAVLQRLGVRSALVAVSGDLAFSDAPPGQHGWRIRLHAGDATLSNVPEVVELTHAAVSTSGSAEQHVDIGGRRYSHVIDPSSGMGLENDVTVTVIAGHGLDADGLDTALSVLGAERGLRLIEARSDAAALIVQRGRTGTTVSMSSGFAGLIGGSRSGGVTGR